MTRSNGLRKRRDQPLPSGAVTYLERDVRNLLRVGNLRDFDRFLRACASRTGQLLNMSDLGDVCGGAMVCADVTSTSPKD